MVSVTENKVALPINRARMIVFVPDMLVNVSDFARQVYIHAITQQRDVVYLSLNGREADQLSAARQLAMLAALTQGPAVTAWSHQLKVEHLPESLDRITHPGDLVVWPDRGFLAPLSLENELGITQYVLPEVRTTAAPAAYGRFNTLLFWLFGLVIVAGFFYIEMIFDGLISGAASKAIPILLVTIELGILYKLNRMLG